MAFWSKIKQYFKDESQTLEVQMMSKAVKDIFVEAKEHIVNTDAYQIGKALITDKDFAREVLDPKAFVEFQKQNIKEFIDRFKKQG